MEVRLGAPSVRRRFVIFLIFNVVAAFAFITAGMLGWLDLGQLFRMTDHRGQNGIDRILVIALALSFALAVFLLTRRNYSVLLNNGDISAVSNGKHLWKVDLSQLKGWRLRQTEKGFTYAVEFVTNDGQINTLQVSSIFTPKSTYTELTKKLSEKEGVHQLPTLKAPIPLKKDAGGWVAITIVATFLLVTVCLWRWSMG